jgi:homoserine kinase
LNYNSMKKIEKQWSAFAPATVANLGLGFDILGLAINNPGDTVRASLSDKPGIKISKIVGDNGFLPQDPDKNTAGIAARETLKKAGVDIGVELILEKGLPIGSGLGSSAASAAAAAMAINLLLGSPFRKIDLIGPCIEAEAMVSGRHADNVAPALLGGLILIRSLEPLDLVRLPIPTDLTLVVVSPEFELATKMAREVLPDTVPLKDLVKNTANLSALVSCFYTQDLALLSRCLPDQVVSPVRAALIPGGTQVIEAALGAGALGSSISGSGPSIFAFCRSPQSAGQVGKAMAAAFKDAGLKSKTIISPASCPGARRV